MKGITGMKGMKGMKSVKGGKGGKGGSAEEGLGGSWGGRCGIVAVKTLFGIMDLRHEQRSPIMFWVVLAGSSWDNQPHA